MDDSTEWVGKSLVKVFVHYSTFRIEDDARSGPTSNVILDRMIVSMDAKAFQLPGYRVDDV